MPTELDLINKWHDTGRWWTPDRPHFRVWGDLHFDPERGPRLNLLDTLSPQDPSGPTCYPVIHGELGHHAVTLADCRSAGAPIIPRPFRRGPDNERVIIRRLLIGDHVDGNKTFPSCHVRFDNVDELTFSKMPFSETVPLAASSDLHIEVPQSFTIANTSELRCSIKYIWQRSQDSSPHPRFAASVHSEFLFEFAAPRSISYILRTILCARSFLALLCNDAVFLRVIRLRMEGGDVQLLLAQTPSVFGKEVDHAEFAAHDVNVFQNFEAWFQAHENIEWSIKRLYAAQYQEKMYSDIRFLIATQALENLHRAFLDPLYVSEQEFDQFKNSMIKSIPSSGDAALVGRVKRMLDYANEKSLRRKIREVVANTASLARGRDILNKETIAKIVDARNYLTHGGESGLSGDQYLRYCSQVVIGAHAFILEGIGMAPDTVSGLITRWRAKSRFLLN